MTGQCRLSGSTQLRTTVAGLHRVLSGLWAGRWLRRSKALASATAIFEQKRGVKNLLTPFPHTHTHTFLLSLEMTVADGRPEQHTTAV